MDCRMSALAALGLLMGSGCVTTQSQPVPNPSDPASQIVVTKPKEGPKRPPLPGTVVAMALMREREADKLTDTPQKMRLYDEARQYYQQALKIDPKYREATQGLARVYTRMDDFSHAFETYRKALDKTPDDHGLWFDMGMCHNRKKELAQAQQCFQKALQLDPENRQYMKTLGFTLARAGQTEKGLALLTQAMGTAQAHYNIARLLDHMGQMPECRKHLEMALQINPNLEEARAMLAGLDTPHDAPPPTLSFATE